MNKKKFNKLYKKYNSDLKIEDNYYGYVNSEDTKSDRNKSTVGYLKRMREQRDKFGFDNGEIFNLDVSFSKWMSKRLKRFIKVNNGYPVSLTEKKWNKILKKMYKGFKLNSKYTVFKGDKKYSKIEKAYKLFSKHHNDIWY